MTKKNPSTEKKQRRPDVKRGARLGYVVPARIELAPLSVDERGSLLTAIGEGAELAIASIEFAILSVVREALTYSERPTEREIAFELIDVAKAATNLAERLIPERFDGAVPPIREAAKFTLVEAGEGATIQRILNDLTWLAKVAASKADDLDMKASRAVRHPDPAASLFLSVRNALKEARIKVSLPSDAEDYNAEAFPLFRTAKAAASITAARLKGNVHAEKFAEISNLTPRALCRRIGRAKRASASL